MSATTSAPTAKEEKISLSQLFQEVFADSAIAKAVTIDGSKTSNTAIITKKGLSVSQNELDFLLGRLHSAFSDVASELGVTEPVNHQAVRNIYENSFVVNVPANLHVHAFSSATGTYTAGCQFSITPYLGNTNPVSRSVADVIIAKLRAEFAQPCWQIFHQNELAPNLHANTLMLKAACIIQGPKLAALHHDETTSDLSFTMPLDTRDCPNNELFLEHFGQTLYKYQQSNPTISFYLPLHNTTYHVWNYRLTKLSEIQSILVVANRPALLNAQNNQILDTPAELVALLEKAKASYFAQGLDIFVQAREMGWSRIISVEGKSGIATALIGTGTTPQDMAASRFKSALKAMGASNTDTDAVTAQTETISVLEGNKIRFAMPLDTMRTFLSSMSTEEGKALYTAHMNGTAKSAALESMARLSKIMAGTKHTRW
jgi:hypothetical protein